MLPVRGPVLRRRRLGTELRTLREQAGLTIQQVARASARCRRSAGWRPATASCTSASGG
jgi:hypothetical protein